VHHDAHAEDFMLRLRDIMTTDVATVGPETTMREAVELLAIHHLSGAPVVEGGRVVGVVSTSDVLELLTSAPPVPAGRDESDVSLDDASWEPTEEEADEMPSASFFTGLWADDGAETLARFASTAGPEWDVLAEHTVGEVMTRQVLALPPTLDVSAAADRMRTADVHRVLVMQDGRLLGIATTTDFLRAVADHRIARRTFVFDTSPVERDHDRGPF
jgi:CBS domain-containing protein